MKCRSHRRRNAIARLGHTGFREYQKRLRTPLVLELEEIPLVTCRAGENPQPAMAREGERMLAALGPEDHVVALEVSGSSMSTERAVRLVARASCGKLKPLALLIGSPMVSHPPASSVPMRRWSLSPLTLPHALVRILVAEQIYRAMSLAAGHPYHRA